MAFDDIESTFADAVDGDANARKTISTILRRVNSPQQPVVVMQQPQQQPVEEPLDPVEYETRVQERVRALDDKLSFTDAQNWFHHEFSDVVNDERRWQWAARNDAELARTHPELSHKARLQIIGQAARSVPSGHDVDSTEAVQEMMRSRRRVDLDGTGEEIDLSDNVPTSEDRERSDAIKKCGKRERHTIRSHRYSTGALGTSDAHAPALRNMQQRDVVRVEGLCLPVHCLRAAPAFRSNRAANQ